MVVLFCNRTLIYCIAGTNTSDGWVLTPEEIQQLQMTPAPNWHGLFKLEVEGKVIKYLNFHIAFTSFLGNFQELSYQMALWSMGTLINSFTQKCLL